MSNISIIIVFSIGIVFFFILWCCARSREKKKEKRDHLVRICLHILVGAKTLEDYAVFKLVFSAAMADHSADGDNFSSTGYEEGKKLLKFLETGADKKIEEVLKLVYKASPEIINMYLVHRDDDK